MKFMINFNHVGGVWDRRTPAQRERHGLERKQLREALSVEWARKGRFLVGSNEVRQILEGTI